MNIKVLVATHKEYAMPEDKCYIPIHVGRDGKDYIGYMGDNTGNNISYKNANYCELTGLYWGAKNLDCDYLGLVHYRRHFCLKRYITSIVRPKFKYILTEVQMKSLLEEFDLILPTKRNYYIETLYSHYSHTHYQCHLDETREIIKLHCKDYLEVFDKVMKRRSGYMFNMFIMKKSLVDEYCNWLFPILEELENRIDISEYSSYQARLYGRVSELLFNVWLEKQSIRYIEIPHIHMERINWFNKILLFLLAKFRKNKFEKSF